MSCRCLKFNENTFKWHDTKHILFLVSLFIYPSWFVWKCVSPPTTYIRSIRSWWCTWDSTHWSQCVHLSLFPRANHRSRLRLLQTLQPYSLLEILSKSRLELSLAVWIRDSNEPCALKVVQFSQIMTSSEFLTSRNVKISLYTFRHFRPIFQPEKYKIFIH